MPAVVNPELCTGCETCLEGCPVECISMNDVAHVDADECIDCGVCEAECPEEAIALE